MKEYLSCLTKAHNTVLLAYGGGSIKRNGVYDEVTGILRARGQEDRGVLPASWPTPPMRKVLEGAELARESGADMILGRGRRLGDGLLQGRLAGRPV